MPPQNYRWFTPEEEDLMRRHYGPQSPDPMPTADLARLLGRAPSTVRKAALRLGLAGETVSEPKGDEPCPS